MTADAAGTAAAEVHLAGTGTVGSGTVGSGAVGSAAGATVVHQVGSGTVVKTHDSGTDPAALGLRVATAARHPGLFVPPLGPAPVALDGRQVTRWPYGTPVDPDDPDAAPWEATATLAALLHRTPAAPDMPPMRGPVKAAEAVGRLRSARLPADLRPLARDVLGAWAALPAWARARAPMPDITTLCHGDLHLGQLVRHPAGTGPWRLIDVDDMGTGVAAWDLARPAAWYACGLLPGDEWARFLDAYRSAGGPAVPAGGDPWPALDVPARAVTVQTAARALAKAAAAGRPLDEAEQAMARACARMPAGDPDVG